MIFFTSDTHFGHHNIIEYCQRPFSSVEEMDESLVQKWNEVVKPKDTVFHLGDLAFKYGMISAHKLNGKKFLILGNHDLRIHKCRFRDAGFTLLSNNYKFYDLNLTHWPHPQNFDPEYINICGHVHNNWRTKDGWVNVGVDAWDFKPISFEELRDFIFSNNITFERRID